MIQHVPVAYRGMGLICEASSPHGARGQMQATRNGTPRLDTIEPPATAEPIALAPIMRLLWTPKEAAAALGISPRLLWSKTKIGEIPCLRIGKAVRYSPAALQKWIDRASPEK